MGVKRFVENPFTGQITYYDEYDREIGHADPNPIMGGYTLYDAKGKNVGYTYDDPITQIQIIFDKKGNKNGYTFNNEFYGTTEFYDEKWDKKGTVNHNLFSYEQIYEEEEKLNTIPSSEGHSSYSSSYYEDNSEREQLFNMPNINFTSIDTGTETHEEKREEPEISFNQQIGKMFSDMPKSFDDTDMFAVYAAALLQRNSVPYDGTYHQLSAIKRLRNGEWEIDYTEDEVIDEKMDSYYLLDDEVEIDDGAADIGIIDTNHFLTVLFGNGMIYSGKYKCRETRREYNERLIEWNRQKASDNISLIEKYLYEKDILFDFDAFLRMKG